MKYWVYINGEVPGNYEPPELAHIHGFNNASMVCPAEGNLADRNWQRAALFPDIAKALEEFNAQGTTPAPLASPSSIESGEPVFMGLDPKEILSGTSQRLFHHVGELMKELENRREERALTQTLQRNLAQLRNELLAARERIGTLEEKASLVPGFEDRERKTQDLLERAQRDLKERDKVIEDLKRVAEDTHRQLAETRHSLAQTSAEYSAITRHNGELNNKLAEKELALAQALSTLQRLDKELGQILPENLAGIRKDIPKS